MARLSRKEKEELLADAASEARRRDFEALRASAVQRALTPAELLDFLEWAQCFSTERLEDRRPIQGDRFLM